MKLDIQTLINNEVELNFREEVPVSLEGVCQVKPNELISYS